MSLTIDLPPEIETELRSAAEKFSMSLDELVGKMITEVIGGDIAAISNPPLSAEIQTRFNERRDENAEAIINEAVQEMKENQVRNREIAVNTLTFKNNLQAEVESTEQIVRQLEKKAKIALQEGREELAKRFFQEMLSREHTLHSMRKNLLIATEAAEKVKASIRREEERIRSRTAEALAAATVLKQAQLLVQMDEARVEANEGLEDFDSAAAAEVFEKWAAKNRSEEASTKHTDNQLMKEMETLQRQLDRLQADLLRHITEREARQA